MEDELPPSWLDISGCVGKRANVVNGHYVARAKPVGEKPSYQKVASYETPVVLWFNMKKNAWYISVFRTLADAKNKSSILVAAQDCAENPINIVATWFAVDHKAEDRSKQYLQCPDFFIKKAEPLCVRISGRMGSNAHKINGHFSQRGENIGNRYSFIKPGTSGDGIILWYWKRKGCWMLSWMGHVGTQNAYAACKDRAKLPWDVENDWMVWDSSNQTFSPDTKIFAEKTDPSFLNQATKLHLNSPASTPSPLLAVYDGNNHFEPGAAPYRDNWNLIDPYANPSTKNSNSTMKVSHIPSRVPPPVPKKILQSSTLLEELEKQKLDDNSSNSTYFNYDLEKKKVEEDIFGENTTPTAKVRKTRKGRRKSYDMGNRADLNLNLKLPNIENKNDKTNDPPPLDLKTPPPQPASVLRRKSVELSEAFSGLLTTSSEDVWATDYLANEDENSKTTTPLKNDTFSWD